MSKQFEITGGAVRVGYAIQFGIYCQKEMLNLLQVCDGREFTHV